MAGSVACCLSQAAYYIAHIQPNSWSLKVIRWKKNANQPKRRLESVANQCWRRETRRYLDMLVDAAGYHNTNRRVPFDCSTMTLRPSMAMVAGRNGFVALDESHSCCAVRRCVCVGKCNLQYKAMSNRKHVGKILAGRLRAATMPIKYEKCQDQCAKPHLRWQ